MSGHLLKVVFVLSGPRANQDFVVSNRHKFVNGIMPFVGSAEDIAALTNYLKHWGAAPVPFELWEAQNVKAVVVPPAGQGEPVDQTAAKPEATPGEKPKRGSKRRKVAGDADDGSEGGDSAVADGSGSEGDEEVTENADDELTL